ncbi:hypothetical protein MNEG_6365 [Monoraphidium neglectum]|uniref:Uncharacterized protein n=1 Tax=Monoraphidium neglectum TaxID=145388 RepID=A0A0D2L2W8_9CHLO|nr:hypothetical protein MNEG_6365 [Monoraphidium neglectum]KIZ01594.1 hypothetical protein MNEG_6365 [Monoraphidium neglectum]|eukprot:XP_013900613.1 hypothetical protein MNEG_6365 [Monoraphidium neglectum]
MALAQKAACARVASKRAIAPARAAVRPLVVRASAQSNKAAVASFAASASVLALAVPQAAQAAQEAFMMAEVIARATERTSIGDNQTIIIA